MEIVEMQAECMTASEKWFPEVAHSLVHHTLALAGEVGEFCNLLKKIERGSVEHTEETHVELAMELTDVLIYVLNMGAVLNVDLGLTYRLKMDYNETRFGAGSVDNAGGDVGADGDDEVPNDSSSFVPISQLSKPLQGGPGF